MAEFVGIDLGTTLSGLAHLKPDGTPEIVPNADGERLTPSVVYFDSHENVKLVGSAARDGGDPDRTIFQIKRHMDDPDYFVELDGKKWTPAEISALILAKLKDRDIELRTATQVPDDDATVVEVLQKMAKQRRESITMYVDGNRPELAEQERKELAVIESFLPQQLSEDDTRAAIEAIKRELGASSLKDMGKVMAELKARHGTELDMSKASALVKSALA